MENRKNKKIKLFMNQPLITKAFLTLLVLPFSACTVFAEFSITRSPGSKCGVHSIQQIIPSSTYILTCPESTGGSIRGILIIDIDIENMAYS